jgi:hypothetical protein
LLIFGFELAACVAVSFTAKASLLNAAPAIALRT